MSIFDKWKEYNEGRRQSKLTADRPVKLTINYSTLSPVDVPWASLALSVKPGQLVIVAPWSTIKPYVFDEDKKAELRQIPGFDCCVLEILK